VFHFDIYATPVCECYQWDVLYREGGRKWALTHANGLKKAPVAKMQRGLDEAWQD
jgi:hypothetical protein